MDFNVLYLIKLLLSLAIVSLVVVIIIVIKKLGLYYTCFCKVDEKTEKHGGELVGDVLKAHGVKYIFTLVGGHISPILVASEKRDIRIIDTRHEVTAVFAADAVARLSGTVGVAAVTAGPGLTNTVTAVKNAQMAESPLLLIGGAAATLLKGRGALQDIDQMSLFKPLCKFTATIYHVRDIVPTLKEALQQAQSGTPGPVFVEFPIDTLYPYHMVKKEIGMKEDGPTSFMQRIINWYLNNHLNNLFADAWTPKDVTPLPVYIDFATDDKILELSQLLSKSKKPVILLGSQAVLPPTEVSTLRQALESLGVPCFLGGMSRGLLGRNNPIHIRQDRKQALKEADLVILAGSVCDFRLGYGRALNRRSKIVAINRNHEQLHKNSDMFWKPTLALQVDTGNTIVRLAKSLPGYKCDSDWCEKLKQREVAKEEANSVKAEKTTDVHLNPMKVLSQVDEVLDDDAILVADGGDFVATAAYILRPRGPLTWLDPGAFGTLGVGGGFALGAKLCRPDSDIWVIYGDGSLGYSIVEFDTYKRHKTPVIAVIGNDAGWTQIAREQVPMFGTDVACKLEYTAYDDVVKGFGAIGYKLDRSNQSDTLNILREAIQKSKENSVLINCMIGKTDFREGSISV